ncbi:hypothetical protein K7X08_013057 [Anisodus acutangulus]|uniref:Inositol-pentakisphosphate 2-kinase n=1 Tax=Anisodus acutangulus TaxID=402998 RepID=A0A9Q1RH48_9SOLA|nr:hypothetical protein K7X08_013057 [Anisodus acutangulus]
MLTLKDESLTIVRNCLIAATAKDLSMMISFRPREDESVESPYSMVSLESTNQSFDYKAYFIESGFETFREDGILLQVRSTNSQLLCSDSKIHTAE